MGGGDIDPRPAPQHRQYPARHDTLLRLFPPERQSLGRHHTQSKSTLLHIYPLSGPFPAWRISTRGRRGGRFLGGGGFPPLRPLFTSSCHEKSRVKSQNMSTSLVLIKCRVKDVLNPQCSFYCQTGFGLQ